MQVSVGRIVLYLLTQLDAEQINQRRTTGPLIANRIKIKAWPLGAQAHIGDVVLEGDVFPMIVTCASAARPGVNGQVFLDGNDTLWVREVREGADFGCWQWPPRVAEPSIGSEASIGSQAIGGKA